MNHTLLQRRGCSSKNRGRPMPKLSLCVKERVTQRRIITLQKRKFKMSYTQGAALKGHKDRVSSKKLPGKMLISITKCSRVKERILSFQVELASSLSSAT